MRTPRVAPLLAAFALLPLAQAADVPSALPAAPGREWIANLFNSWKAPVPPRHLGGNLYYVGASGVSSWLITTPEGLILLDTGFEETVPIILRGVEQLGFRPADIRLILSSHAHIDHTGGHALMKQATGADIVASAAEARVLESGGADDFLNWPKDTLLYAPVKVDRIIGDREMVSLGGVNLTAHLTPGHTRGATTWTMELTDGGRTYDVVFFSSATINDGTRLLGNAAYPGIVADLEKTFARLKLLPCDIFLAPHGGQFAMADKFARLERGEGIKALVDPEGWERLIAGAEKAFGDQLAKEQTAQTP
jgi:metallo-beta-lactamase class B